jgi:hypothetical protein
MPRLTERALEDIGHVKILPKQAVISVNPSKASFGEQVVSELAQ